MQLLLVQAAGFSSSRSDESGASAGSVVVLEQCTNLYEMLVAKAQVLNSIDWHRVLLLLYTTNTLCILAMELGVYMHEPNLHRSGTFGGGSYR